MKRLIAMAAVLAAGTVSAQETPTPTIQGLDNFSIERPAPARPDSAATPVPIPAAPVIVLPSPTAAPSRGPRQRTPAPTAAPTVVPVPTPDISAVTPAVEPVPTPAATPTPPPPAERGWSWWWALGILLLAGLASALAFWWRSRDEAAVEQPAPPIPAEPVAATPAPAIPSSGFITSALRATIGLELKPIRAAMDSLRVQLEYELVIANTGAAKSRELFVELAMLSAGTSQDMALAAFYSAPPGEPIAESDGLAAGNSARLGGEAVLARDAFDLITAGGKRMIVPVVAVRVLGTTGAVVAKAAWLVGIERAGEARMAPLRLDGRAVQEALGVRAYP